MPTIAVVILNWNGAQDTIDCLESLTQQTLRPLRLVVVDNGSQDDSVARIDKWKTEHQGDAGLQLVVIEAGENLGFAAGSNVGIRYALKAGAESVLVLNNDTVLAPDAVYRMAAFLSEHPDYVAVTGQIRYFGRPVIWNCGGELTWFGSRRYLFGEQTVESTPQDGWRRISFVTGCAALIRASVFERQGLFTERFFFGEEDYEFSQRLKRAQNPIAVCFGAVIQHKVGSSIDRAAPTTGLGRYYIYYLNRFIDMKDYYPRPIWWLWRWFSLAFVLPRLKLSRQLSWSGLALLGRRLIRDSARLDGVSRQRFEAANRSGLEAL